MRVVFDCNIYFQALISPRGPSGRCVDAALERRVELVCSRYTLRELRETADTPELRERFGYDEPRVAMLIQNIEKVSVFVDDAPDRFTLPRDPDDAHYINLALATGAACVVSRDNDLLHLPDLGRPEGREFRQRFPSLRIMEPTRLLAELSA